MKAQLNDSILIQLITGELPDLISNAIRSLFHSLNASKI